MTQTACKCGKAGCINCKPDLSLNANICTDTEVAIQGVEKIYGSNGMKAIAMFMHAMGSEAVIHFSNGDFTPCDFVMQQAWAYGGEP